MSSQPRTRRRKADDMAVPSGSDEPAERKRVLNVLAQRRYRKRKRDHVKALESQISGNPLHNTGASSELSSEKKGTPSVETAPPEDTDLLQVPEITESSLDGCVSEDWLITPDTAGDAQVYVDASTYPSQEVFYSDLGQMSLGPQSQSRTTINQSGDSMTADFLAQQQLTALEELPSQWTATTDIVNSQSLLSSADARPSDWTWDPLDFMPMISFASTPEQDSTSPESQSIPPSSSSSSTFTPTSTSSSSSTSPKPANPLSTTLPTHTTALLQIHHTTHTTFPDTSALSVPDLTLLRAFLSIASVFDLTQKIWSLTATSPFCSPSPPPLPPNLPLNLHPTRLQRTIPHHPILDLLPWPVTRDKLILVFSSPLHLRPPQAQSDTALLELVYDIEDDAEGVRVWGESPFEEESWEVGEKVFKGWWWAFDMEIVRRSNEFRRGRGVGGLKMGIVVGEV